MAHDEKQQSAERGAGEGYGPDSEAKRRKVSPVTVVLALLLVAALAALAYMAFFKGGEEDPFSSFFDSSAEEGQAPWKSPEEIQAEIDRIVEEGMFNISIASVIEFEDGASEGTAYVENVPGNPYNMKAIITLDDTGEVLFESGGLAPNSYIESVTLSRDLDAGNYAATATFYAYDLETLEEVGQAAAKITLVVKG